MNKKNLSVVMAGAMLATSVAPVLADTTTTETYKVTKGNAGLLIDKLDSYFNSCDKFFDKNDANYPEKPIYTYRYREVGTINWTYAGYTSDNKVNTDTIKNIAKSVTDENNYEIEVVELGNIVDKDGKIVSVQNKKPVYTETTLKYTAGQAKEMSQIIYNPNTSSYSGKYAKLRAAVNAGYIERGSQKLSNNDKTVSFKTGNGVTMTLSDGDYALDFEAPINKDGKKTTTATDVVDFLDVAESAVYAQTEKISEKVIYDILLVEGDETLNYTVDELYDGLMLTEKGHELLRNVVSTEATIPGTITKTLVDGKYVYSFEFTMESNDITTIVTIKGDKEAKTETLRAWLAQGHADVDILAGSNRYATAVEIAKTFVEAQYTPHTVRPGQAPRTDLKNIVMVNGEALVDGLAAAPYAHALNGSNGAPILLTADSHLPKETRDYLKELAADYKLGALPTIHIIGGESVVSQNVVNELKDIGFKVKRISGDNREETSLAVADKLEEVLLETYSKEEVKEKFNDEVFVVGAEGEVDAMSIASYAAASETPIIVSKSTKGLSTVGLNEIGNFENVEIIGGTAVVSESDEEAIKELVKDEKKVTRVYGDNRYETNAAVIKKYHENFKNVLVTNDGAKDKTKLVDALPVSIFASANVNEPGEAAPIVLSESKLSDAQLNQVVLNAQKDAGTGKMAGTLYQVGGSVETSVMEKLAERLGFLR